MSDRDQLSEQEIAKRMEDALKRAFKMPHKPHANERPGQKPKERPASKGRVRKGKSRA
jgi:hypothetical protein